MMSRKTRISIIAAVVVVLLGQKVLQRKSDDPPADGKRKPAVATAIARRSHVAAAPSPSPRARCARSRAATAWRRNARPSRVPGPRQAGWPQDRAQPRLAPGDERGRRHPGPAVHARRRSRQAAVETFPAIKVDPLLREVRKRRHIVLVDQRGTGKSNKLACKPGDDGAGRGRRTVRRGHAHPGRGLRGRPVEARGPALLHHHRRGGGPGGGAQGDRRRPGQPDGRELRHPRRPAVRDAPPDAIRSIVLDSPVPNTIKLGNIFARNLEDALALQFAQCTKVAACKDALGDPRAELETLLTSLRAQPATVRYRDAVNRRATRDLLLRAESVAGLVRMYAYMPAAPAALLPS